jgi:hypothetical protein
MAAYHAAVAALVTILGCARSTSDTGNAKTTEGASTLAQVTLATELPQRRYAWGEDIIIVATVRNGGNVPVSLDEGRFVAVFCVNGETRTFLQSVRASCKTGVKTVTVSPGEEYQEPFTVHLKAAGQQPNLQRGTYRVRVCYRCRKDGEPWRPSVIRRMTQIDRGVVKTLESEEVDLRIR